MPARPRQRAVFRRVGRQLVDRHGHRLRRARRQPDHRPVELHRGLQPAAAAIGRQLLAQQRPQVGAVPALPRRSVCASAIAAIRPITAFLKAAGSSVRVRVSTDCTTASAFLARWSTSRASSIFASSDRLRSVMSTAEGIRWVIRPAASRSGATWKSIAMRLSPAIRTSTS